MELLYFFSSSLSSLPRPAQWLGGHPVPLPRSSSPRLGSPGCGLGYSRAWGGAATSGYAVGIARGGWGRFLCTLIGSLRFDVLYLESWSVNRHYGFGSCWCCLLWWTWTLSHLKVFWLFTVPQRLFGLIFPVAPACRQKTNLCRLKLPYLP